MVSEIVSFLAGGIATGIAVLPYAIKCDRLRSELIDLNEQQACSLANATAHALGSDRQLVDAAFKASEDATVIATLTRREAAHEAEISSLNERLYGLKLEYQAITTKLEAQLMAGQAKSRTV